jgi:hypothetical protein
MKVQTFNFRPHGVGSTQVMSVTAASSSITISAGAPALYVYNAGTGLAFIRWTQGASNAVATDLPLPPGTVQVFSKGPEDTFSAICPGGTATVYVTPGAGS